MLDLNYELRRVFSSSIDERGNPMDNAIRNVCGVAITINTRRRWPIVRLLTIEDVARTVTEATGMLVNSVRLVTPNDVAAEMLLWPPKHTLWDAPIIDELKQRAPECAFKIEYVHGVATKEINELAMYGIRKNFSRYDRDLRDQLVRQFGHAAGDACANHIALCIVGDHDAVRRTGALVSLFVHAPFMTRDPLNPHKLLILVDNDI